MNNEPQRDWFKIWVHFFCGLVVGGGIGAYCFSEWHYIIIAAVVVGILAAVFLDDFWDDFLSGGL